MMDDKKHERQFLEVRQKCPWRDGDNCSPSKFKLNINYLEVRKCSQKECPMMSFRVFFDRPEINNG